ncbi:MAG: hypothetical protein LAO30_05480 [Acidobacteriia bacterium]|nr:hypothetical protein [Terriglobia bacterium]
MAKTKNTDVYKGIWLLTPPSGKEPYKARLQWKRFYGPNDERFGLFKILPIRRAKRAKKSVA